MISRPQLVPTENGYSRFVAIQSVLLHVSQLVMGLFYHTSNKGVEPVKCHIAPTAQLNDNEVFHNAYFVVEFAA